MKKLVFSLVVLSLLVAPTAQAERILIQGAKVHTLGTLGSIENADVLIEDGKITEIGTGLTPGGEIKIIDARGKEVSPGIMNPATALGLVEIGAVKSTVDYSNTDKSYSASLSIADVINPNSSLWSHNRSNGLTHAMVMPSNTKALFSGQGSAIQLTDDLEHVIARDNVVVMSYGDRAAERAGGTRALALQQIRAVFKDLRALSEAEDQSKFKPKGHLKLRELQALLPVLTESRPVVVNAHRANDILMMLEIAKQYALTMIIQGAEEAWKVKEQVAEAKVALMLNPYSNLPNKFENIGNRIDQMSILHEAGIPMMISNLASHNAYIVRQVAGNAAAYGLPWETALAAITKVPAQWFGMHKETGSLESGMPANLVIWDGDPLETTTSAEQVFIGGKMMDMTSRQTKLRDRYMSKESKASGYRF